MIEANNNFSSWEDVIINFFEYKISKSNLFKARESVKKVIESIKNENNESKRIKLVKKLDENNKELTKFRNIAPSTEIRDWIDVISNKTIPFGMRIIKATHVLKFGHGSADSDGLFLSEKHDDKLLSTASLKKDMIHDMAHNNGSLITISRFLALSYSDEIIIDLILGDKFSFLEQFALNDSQLANWKVGLKGLVESRTIMSADKAKQIYFPIVTDKNSSTGYRILVPLFASSLAEEIYLLEARNKYGEESKKIRDSMSNGGLSKYNPSLFIDFPNLAIQKFGGAQPQNVSMLNKGRGGISYLVNASPPQWQSLSAPPIYQKSFFDQKLKHHISKDDMEYLRDFLIRFDLIDMSIRNPEKRKWINAWAGRIIEDVLAYASYIQNSEAGWSAAGDIRLKREHQLLLDPYREDQVFQMERKLSGWQSMVCEDFARWLNRSLVGKDKQFSPQREHTRMWIAMMERQLREHDELIKMEVKAGKVKV